MLTIFGTGHRPEDSGGFNLAQMTTGCLQAIREATTPITSVISGGAAGFDLAIALAAMELDLNLILARPWAGHKPRNNESELWGAVAVYPNLHIVDVRPETKYPGVHVYHERNKWMVDHANAGLAFWNGKTSGGTYRCLLYAESVGKPVRNIYPPLVG